MIRYTVSAPPEYVTTAGENRAATIKCDVEATTGGDCTALLAERSSFVAFGLDHSGRQPYSSFLLMSSTSHLLTYVKWRQLRALTLNAFKGVPLVGVVFRLDAALLAQLDPAFARDGLSSHVPPHVVAALARTVLVRAGVPRASVALYGQAREHSEACMHVYMGESEADLLWGLKGMLAIPGWEGCEAASPSLAVPYRKECGVEFVEAINFNLTFGFEEACHTESCSTLEGSLDRECAASVAPLVRNTAAQRARPELRRRAAERLSFVYVCFSVFIAGVTAPLLLHFLVKVQRGDADQQRHVASELLRAFPPLQRAVAGLREEEVPAYVTKRITNLARIDASLDGETQDTFESVALGIQGSLLQAAYTMGVAFPLHTFLAFDFRPWADYLFAMSSIPPARPR